MSIREMFLKLRPNASPRFEVAIVMAMPTVKPTTMLSGTSRAIRPRPSRPMSMSTRPAMIETDTRKGWPYLPTIMAMTGMNAAVGP